MDCYGFDWMAGQIPIYREQLLTVEESVKEQAFDIRFKSGQPVAICGREGVFFLCVQGGTTRALEGELVRINEDQMKELFLRICSHSVFSHEQEIKKGYVRVNGSCRAGICGTAVLEDGKVKGLRDITTIVFRIPREKKGCADRLFLEQTDFRGGILIVGEPSSGKTTFLRDVAYSLSTGKFFQSGRVAVLDERGELGGVFDLGPCADVLCGYPKSAGFDAAIRMLSPEYLLCDELADQDLDAVQKSVFAGVPLIASVHASGQDLEKRPLCRRLLETGAFHTVVYLKGRESPGEILKIEKRGEPPWIESGSLGTGGS